MKQYSLINNILGWIIFGIAAFVFLSTIEPTASFWDCGEFIATAFKLQVGHPPGAPLFLMLSRIMSLFAGSNLEQVPVMVNILSALASAFTILFMFWTLTMIIKKMVLKEEEEMTTGAMMTILGAASVGALAYTFSDSFWFSAAEGEVYATSSFFTAFVVWAMFKWEKVADERHANRWLILIAYMMGLSIGVHLLNLLAIPALAFIYYFRKYDITRMGIIKTALAGVGILVAVQYGIIPGIVIVATKFELIFINGFGLPFGTGIIIYSILIVVGIVWGLLYTKKKNQPTYNTAILCLTFIIIGYTSFAQIVIRSSANPPMDENDPENVFSLLSYLNREQYGDRPLAYGQYYDAQVVKQEEGADTYIKGETKYVSTGKKVEATYDPKRSTVLPRMYSSQANHISAYKEWSGVKGDQKAEFSNNIKFLVSYQLGHMYWRYFMWNFAGRQNDIQGHGGITKGNWLSGINFLDEMRLGKQSELSESMRSNKAYNKFYMLPMILGLIGLLFHFKNDKHNAWIVTLIFFFTGIAIVIYLNGTPYQPRERDYAYAGSFYAFAFWIGIGALAIINFLKKYVNVKLAAPIATVACLLFVPGIMAKEGWDDHSRAHRFTSRDFATNYLNSCAPNAIIFTNGDNDTFPLWYAQEVEGVRTDVRVVNLSLLNTDWYIDQMKRKAYISDAVPFSLEHSQYVQGTRDYIPYYKRFDDSVEIKELVDFISSERTEAKVTAQSGVKLNYYPTKKFKLTVDKAAVLKNGVVKPEDADKMVDVIEWSIDKNYLMKADIMILDLLAHFAWKRPIYFAVTVNSENFLGLDDYFQLEGLGYRFVPIKTPSTSSSQPGRVEEDVMYDNMMNKFEWGNMKDPRVYLDQNNVNMTSNFRNNFGRLAESLLSAGKRDSAEKTLDKCMEEMPDATVPYNVFVIRLAELYYLCDSPLLNAGQELTASGQTRKAGATQKANEIVKRLSEIYQDDLHYYFSLKGTPFAKYVERDMNQAMAIMQELIRISQNAQQTELTKQLQSNFAQLQIMYTGGKK